MPAKLLLTEDVEDLGRSGDIVTVRPGYARNFLFPRKLAVQATAHTLRMQAQLQAARKEKASKDRQEAEAIAAQMVGLTVSVEVKVDQEGHMYGSVSAADVLALIETQHKMVLCKKSIQLKHPIKELGIFELPIKLPEGVTSQVTVKVMAEGATEQE